MSANNLYKYVIEHVEQKVNKRNSKKNINTCGINDSELVKWLRRLISLNIRIGDLYEYMLD